MLTGLETLRIKESDRIAALAIELRKVGCHVVESADAIEITPPEGRGEAVGTRRIGTWDDHRIAMAFGLLGSVAGDVVIEDAECVAKTWPEFWEVFADIGGRVTSHD